MPIFFSIAGALAFIGGIATFQVKGAVAEIEALILFLMATLSFGFAAVIRAIAKAQIRPATSSIPALGEPQKRNAPERYSNETDDEYRKRLQRLGLS